MPLLPADRAAVTVLVCPDVCLFEVGSVLGAFGLLAGRRALTTGRPTASSDESAEFPLRAG